MAVTVTSNEKYLNKEMGFEEGEEKWVNHYSSNHQILLVGDGDFSFSLSLALSFGSASNIVASSLDSYGEVINKYKNAESNLQKLEELGASHLHGVDATKMKLHSDLKMRKFDRIIFSFPHAGFYGKEDDVRLINKHKELVSSFFANARDMLRPFGEIHVNHKTTPPFCCWSLEELASENSLALIETLDFRKEDYPGYNNKRGDGSRCNEPFPLGKCSTFMFRFFPSVNKFKVRAHVCSRDETSHKPPQEIEIFDGLMFEQHCEVPFQIQRRPLCDLTNLIRDGRLYQSRELAPSRNQQLVASFGRDPQEVISKMKHLVASFGLDPSMSNNIQSHRPQEAPFGIKHLSASFGSETSMSDIPFHLRTGKINHMQEKPSSFDYIARNAQLNDRDSWTHERTYSVRDQGPSLHYERFLHKPRDFRR